jgi:capsular polysaccharide biosynthesis protein
MANSSKQHTHIDNREEEIDLLELFQYLKRKLFLIILVFCVGLIGAGVYTKLCITPKYTATSKLYVVSSSGKSVVNLDDLRLGTSLSSDYVELLKTRPVCTSVIEDLGLDYTYAELRKMYDIECLEDTRILVITAVSTSPTEARDIANAVADKAITYLPKIMEITAPSIAEEAVEPTKKSSPNVTKNAMMGGLLALVLIVGIYTVLFVMDDTVKSAEDIERLTGVMPLTVIPEDDKQAGYFRRRRKEKYYE